jgi:sortase (surface protein transpeptidase)
VRIPSIDVETSMIELGLLPDGSLEAPEDFDVAGWYAAGPEPGEPGPSVIAGHVDSQHGPAVFYRLRELQPGAEVKVQAEDGTSVDFRVERIEMHPKDAFPTEAVYADTPGPTLRLITCGGEFDRDEGSYRDNVVVFATLA